MMRQGTLFHPSANVVMEKIGADKFYVEVLGEVKKKLRISIRWLVYADLLFISCFYLLLLHVH
jgi:hypothetical protein